MTSTNVATTIYGATFTSCSCPCSSHCERFRRRRAQKRMMDDHSASELGIDGASLRGKWTCSTWEKARWRYDRNVVVPCERSKARMGVVRGGEKVGICTRCQLLHGKPCANIYRKELPTDTDNAPERRRRLCLIFFRAVCVGRSCCALRIGSVLRI